MDVPMLFKCDEEWMCVQIRRTKRELAGLTRDYVCCTLSRCGVFTELGAYTVVLDRLAINF